jgi:N-acetylmuramoyl-L-alanine amidase
MGRKGVFLSVAAWSLAVCFAAPAAAQRVYLNPSDQTANAVAGGGNEAQYALINANLTRPILEAAGFTVQVDQNFNAAPSNANSWGADIFVSIHTNAGGGHGIETLYKSTGGQTLAGHVQDGLLSKLPYQTRGLKYRDNLHVLNNTDMFACLTEALFHDCATSSGYQGHPPSESDFLRSGEGQQKIAQGIATGVCSYFGKSCGTAPQPTTGHYVGVVYRAPNLEDRLEGAFVQVAGGASTTTGPDGAFSFELDPGSYTVTATLDGFQPGSSTRDVVAGEEVWGSIGLEVAEPEPDAGPEAAPQDAAVEDVVVEDVALPEASPEAAPTAARPWTSEEGSGCACGVARRRGPSGAWLLLLAGVFLLRRR